MLPDMRTKLRALLVKHEGLKTQPYTDQTGHITIGIGRNLSVRGITETEAFTMLDDDMMYFTDKLATTFSWFSSLDENRQVALIDMAFNLGLNGLLEFKNMLAAIEKQDYQLAAICMMQSKWALQVGNRAVDLSNIIRTGTLDALS